jgi:hypothetical protein
MLTETQIPTFTRCPAHFFLFRLGKLLKWKENPSQVLGNGKAIWRIRVYNEFVPWRFSDRPSLTKRTLEWAKTGGRQGVSEIGA